MSREHIVTVFYNGACPICRMEIEHYGKLAKRTTKTLVLVDVCGTEHIQCLLTKEALLERLHVAVNGQVNDGLDAFIVIWDRLPGYRHLANLMRLPVVSDIAAGLYDRVFAPVLFGWYRWRIRRMGAQKTDLITSLER